MTLNEAYPALLACLCIWREARGESSEARLGVWHVLQNRAGHPAFRPTLLRVITQPWQFSSFNPPDKQGRIDPNALKFPTEASGMDWVAWLEICAMADNPGEDNTQRAVYYESFDPAELDAIRAKDSWFAADKLTVTLGKIRFYRF